MFTRFLCLMVATAISCGCNLPKIDATPIPDSKPVEHTLKITVDGGANVTVGGEGTITAKSANPSSTSTVCDCGCGKESCTCSRGPNTAASTVNKPARSGPQFVTQYVEQQVCENGVCRIVRVPVQVPVATKETRSVSGGKITIYDNGSAAGRAMRAAIGSKGVEWKSGTPPAINGVHWWPTAVKPDGSAWSPGAGGWHSGSAAQFDQWAGSK